MQQKKGLGSNEGETVFVLQVALLKERERRVSVSSNACFYLFT